MSGFAVLLMIIAIALLGILALWLWDRIPTEPETHSRIYNEWWKSKKG